MKKSKSSHQSKTVQLEGVGEVLLERSSRARRINLSVRPFKGIRVAVPYGVSFQDALDMARSNTSWLQKQLLRMQHIEKNVPVVERPIFINRAVAKHVLVQRLAALAEQHGFKYKRVFVRNQKTRWGSCSGKNNINLNMNLVRLPARLMDYVLLHELLHTRIKNHSPEFWHALDKLIPNAKALDGELSRYEAMLAT